MSNLISEINYEDIPKISKLTNRRKNPFANKISKEGYSIIIHYTPEDVANGEIDDVKDIAQALIELMPVHDVKRLLLHIKDNYSLPCSPTVWDSIN